MGLGGGKKERKKERKKVRKKDDQGKEKEEGMTSPIGTSVAGGLHCGSAMGGERACRTGTVAAGGGGDGSAVLAPRILAITMGTVILA